MDLNVQDWKEFKVSRTNSQAGLLEIEQCKCGCAGDLEDGNEINYIGAKKSDNGVMNKVKRVDKLVSKGNGIMIICDGQGSVGYANYMDKDFIGSTTTSIGYDNEINSNRALFIVTCLDLSRYKYSYGRKYRPSMNDAIVKLPIKKDKLGNPVIDKNLTYSDDGYIPDFEFMDKYIQSLHHKPISTKRYNLVKLKLEFDKWEEFLVGDIFKLLNGKGITSEEIECNQGNLVVVQSGEDNNGILGKIDIEYCKQMNYTFVEKPCLTVARTGSAGFVSFQAQGCVVGDSAKILLLDESVATNQAYLFFQCLLTSNRFKYDYGRKVTEAKYLNDILKLPIQRDKKGNPIIDNKMKYHKKGYIPDWKFIQEYIDSLPYSDRITEYK